MPKREKPKTGPVPDGEKVQGNWKDTMKSALEKKRPPSGFPKQPDRQQQKK